MTSGIKITLGLSFIFAVMFIFTLFYNFSFIEIKNNIRSIEMVRDLQNIMYHWRSPPLSSLDAGDGQHVDNIILLEPASIAEASDGTVYISDRRHRIWKVDPEGKASVVAGNGYRGWINPSVNARRSKLGRPQGLAVDLQDRLYFADSYNNIVARINEHSAIEVVAGTGVRGFDGEEGIATDMKLDKPYDVAIDSESSIYIIENGNHRLRKVTLDGFMSTLAGAGQSAPSNDPQLAKDASLLSPWGVFVDELDRIYVCDGGTHMIRRINLDGKIERLAGIGTPGYSGDGGPALEAQFNKPEAIYVMRDGSLLINDEFNHVIRLVNRKGIVSTIAGTGERSDLFDPTNSRLVGLNDPEDVIERQDGSILIADHLNGRVISLQPDGSAEIFAGGRTSFEGKSEVGSQIHEPEP